MVNEPVLVDTGPLIALYNERDHCHEQCSDQAKTLPLGKVFTCWPVIVEAAHLLRSYPRDRSRLFDALGANEFVILPLGVSDIRGIQAVLTKYADQEIDLADAALVHLANRHEIATVFSLDLRHFGVLRRKGNKKFRVLPEIA
jgi:predicted nucleic acid-binding protein